MATAVIKIVLRRGTLTEWTTENPVLLFGEVGIIADTNFIPMDAIVVIGDGVSDFNTLYASPKNKFRTQDWLTTNILVQANATAAALVAAEQTTRISVDNNLQSQIDTINSINTTQNTNISNLQSGLATETGQRIAGDASLQTQMTDGDAALQQLIVDLYTNWVGLATTKGSILVYNPTNGYMDILPPGNDGEILVPDSTLDIGVKWTPATDVTGDLSQKADLSGGKLVVSQQNAVTVSYNPTNGQITFTDPVDGDTVIDLPIENLFDNASYNSTTKELTLTTTTGGTVVIPLDDLVDLPEVVVSASSNPGVAPTSGQRLYFRADNGSFWISSGGAWLGPFFGITAAERTDWNSKEPGITPGTTGQYWRGDKSWQTLDKNAVGLGNVDNTSDLNKPISNATSTALTGKKDNFSVLPVSQGGTDSSATLANGRVMVSAGSKIVEHSAITTARALKSDDNGLPIHFDTATEPSLTELGHVKGVTSPIQTQIGGKEPTITQLPINKGGTNSTTALNNNRVMVSGGSAIVEAAAITASRALKSDANGIPVHFDTSTEPSLTELGYVKGLTSPAQTQINNLKIHDYYRVSGRFYALAAVNGGFGGVTTAALVANTVYYVPFIVTKTISIDRLMVGVSATGSAVNLRVGIYTGTSSADPSSLVIDSGALTVSGTGVKTATIASTQLTPGLYFTAIVTDGTVTINAITVGGIAQILGTTGVNTSSGTGYTASLTYGAFPSTHSGALTIVTTTMAAAFARMV